jgi:CheY-like chemotaxis protein
MSDRAVILLAEDREDDILLVQRAFSRANVPNPVYVVRDGEEVIWYLKGEGKYSNRAEYPLPDLLLLDLKMPIKSGFEVLKWIRRQPCLAALRVLVLTSSDSLRDVNLAYRLGANSFLVKPLEFENYIQLGSLIRDYWLCMSETPAIHRDLTEGGPNEEKASTDGPQWKTRRWIE